MFSKCVNCSFYIQTNVEFCPNCGLKNPTEDLPEHIYFSRFITKKSQSIGFKWLLGIFLTFLFLFSFADFSISKVPYLSNFIIFFSFALGMILAFLSPPLIKEIYLKHKRKKIYKTKNNLIEKENIINNRIKELSLREGDIESIIERIGNGKSQKLLETKKQLLSAKEIINSQFWRYQLKKKKIEIVRMQNNVSPIFSKQQLTAEDVKNQLNSLDKHIKKIHQFEKEGQNYESSDIPKSVKSELKDFHLELSESESSLEKIREVLLTRQATLAFKEISSNQATLVNSTDLEELFNDSAVFNIQTSITDFSESFEELEREYNNLEIKSDTYKNLLSD